MLTYTQFWYAWYFVFLERQRLSDEARSWQLYAAALPYAKDAGKVHAEMAHGDRKAHLERMFSMWRELPYSVRRLIALPSPQELVEMGMGDVSPSGLHGVEWWRAELQSAEPGSTKALWLAASLRALDARSPEADAPEADAPEPIEAERSGGVEILGFSA